MNLPVKPVISDLEIQRLLDEDIEYQKWAVDVENQFMAQLERELAMGLPFNAAGIAVCLMCRSPLNELGNCNFCGQRADTPLPSQFFIAKN